LHSLGWAGGNEFIPSYGIGTFFILGPSVERMELEEIGTRNQKAYVEFYFNTG
jgi:hypothetical protein